MEYLLKNKLLSNRQNGFIKGRSMLLQLLNMLDKWTHDLESGGQIDAIYTDSEKAFDKVSHKRLLNKIRNVNTRVLGYRGPVWPTRVL